MLTCVEPCHDGEKNDPGRDSVPGDLWLLLLLLLLPPGNDPLSMKIPSVEAELGVAGV